MNGLFNISILDAGNLSDNDFLIAKKNGCLKDLISGLNLENSVCVKNRIFDNLAGRLLDKLFSLSNCAWPYYYEDGSNRTAALGFICMLTTDNEPTYTEDSTGSSWNIHNVSGSANSSSGGKRFISDQLFSYSIWVDSDREEVIFKNSFLYLPTQCVSDNIKSIGIYYRYDATNSTSGMYTGRLGRVKIKDGSGIPQTLSKTINQVMFVEYTFSLVSV
jgi:hypothetical protein